MYILSPAINTQSLTNDVKWQAVSKYSYLYEGSYLSTIFQKIFYVYKNNLGNLEL